MERCDVRTCLSPATEQIVDDDVDLLVCRLHAGPIVLTPAQQRLQDALALVRTHHAVQQAEEAQRRRRTAIYRQTVIRDQAGNVQTGRN